MDSQEDDFQHTASETESMETNEEVVCHNKSYHQIQYHFHAYPLSCMHDSMYCQLKMLHGKDTEILLLSTW